MPITYQAVKQLSASLDDWSPRRVPEDTKEGPRRALETETQVGARQILKMMLGSAHRAEREERFICSDAGVPVFHVALGTAARLEGDIKQAISDGFNELVATIKPPLLKHVTNPLTNERGYKGKDMPRISSDVAGGPTGWRSFASPRRWAPG